LLQQSTTNALESDNNVDSCFDYQGAVHDELAPAVQSHVILQAYYLEVLSRVEAA
jgi:hypothetical protein